MKILKQADLVIQAVLIAGCFIWVFIPDSGELRLLKAYFIIGGWQLLSFITHLFLKENWLSSKQRKQYGQTLIWILALGIISYLFIPLFLFYLFGLLIVSPFLAIWYFNIGINEWKRIKHHELVHLK